MKTIMWLSNNNTYVWPGSHAADIAGTIQAGMDKVFSFVDAVSGQTVWIRVDSLINWQEVPSAS